MEDNKSKAKYWTFIGYPESMIEDWSEQVSSLLQYPFAYCIHDKDVLEDTGEVVTHRKAHVHFIIAFNNTTTYNHVLKIANKLGVINTVEPCINVRYCYDYLIHDTDDSKKKGKYLYSLEERVLGNNFDIGSYEQLSLSEKTAIFKELTNIARSGQFYNFFDFTNYIFDNFDDKYLTEFKANQSFLNNIIKGNFHKWEMRKEGLYKDSE